jgi:hypothetical protein
VVDLFCWVVEGVVKRAAMGKMHAGCGREGETPHGRDQLVLFPCSLFTCPEGLGGFKSLAQHHRKETGQEERARKHGPSGKSWAWECFRLWRTSTVGS